MASTKRWWSDDEGQFRSQQVPSHLWWGPVIKPPPPFKCPPSILVHDLWAPMGACPGQYGMCKSSVTLYTNSGIDLPSICHTIISHGGWLHRRSRKTTKLSKMGIGFLQGNGHLLRTIPNRFSTSDKIKASACYTSKCRVLDLCSGVNHDGPSLQNLKNWSLQFTVVTFWVRIEWVTQNSF